MNFNDWNNTENIHLSEERKKQFFEIVNKHLDNLGRELKQAGIVPTAYGLRWAHIMEYDEITNQQQEEFEQ